MLSGQTQIGFNLGLSFDRVAYRVQLWAIDAQTKSQILKMVDDAKEAANAPINAENYRVFQRKVDDLQLELKKYIQRYWIPLERRWPVLMFIRQLPGKI